MKSSADDHPKFRDLARRLGLGFPWGAFGPMEALYHFTKNHSPDGGVGKWTNAAIAEAVGWPVEDADTMIEAMIDSGLLDRSNLCRLYVHDWHDHCEDAVHKQLARKTLWFANGQMPSLTRFELKHRPALEAAYEMPEAQGRRPGNTQGQPQTSAGRPPDAQERPALALALASAGALASSDHLHSWSEEERGNVLDYAKRTFAPERNPILGGPKSRQDRTLLLKISSLVVSGRLGEHAVIGAIEGIRRRQTPPDKRIAYLTTVLHENVGGKEKFDTLLASVTVPEDLLALKG